MATAAAAAEAPVDDVRVFVRAYPQARAKCSPALAAAYIRAQLDEVSAECVSTALGVCAGLCTIQRRGCLNRRHECSIHAQMPATLPPGMCKHLTNQTRPTCRHTLCSLRRTTAQSLVMMPPLWKRRQQRWKTWQACHWVAAGRSSCRLHRQRWPMGPPG